MKDISIDLCHSTIHGWMVTKLNLKGNELIIFSIIYGITQDGETEMKGGRSFLAKWINSSLPTVDQALKRLLEKGLIEKIVEEVNGVSFARYKVSLWVVKNFDVVYKETLQGSKETLHKNILTDNIKNNIIDNNIIIKENINKRKVFQKPSIDEIRGFIEELGGGVDAESFYDYYEGNGWMVGRNHMKDWKATVRRWKRSSYGTSDKNNKSRDSKVRFSELDYGESDV